MKKILTVITMALASTLVAQEKTMSSADARAKIGDVIANPSSMTSIMKQLAASDQASYLSDVNAAIAKMPGSADEKAGKFLAVDTAALKGAQKGNLTTLVSEVFATVPPEDLTVVNEQFASGMFNRAADPSKTYTDEQYTKIAQNLLDKVQDRTASADNAGVRNAFAILMLLRASNGTPADLRDKLVNSLKDEKTQQLAQNEWLTPALAKSADYDPMLGAADAGQQPNIDILMPIPYVDAIAAMTGDIADECGLGDCAHSLAAQLSPQFDDPMGYGLSRTPRSTDPLSPANPRYRRGETSRNPTRPLPPGPIPPRPIPPEPDPYDGQSFN